ncbi:hypothetical protein K505DRAFT_239511 [Melanomma pulvis-pyrius CBS 109.77]|uniref:Uncharacterized protein n=1 Tax=Melanomma pulvis-pyrius CBS 109.77 TaxID=1314802 RepID=A0A6A6XIA0_9PLEO|nr:hypothetical protein K505DRAFT_239511 [Melanomma pulvis-pyrius CBS 109.77]
MRYIRFLKTPRNVHEKNSTNCHISCLITITSDLGDSFIPNHVTLSAELCSESSGEVLVKSTVQWTAGMRSLPISLAFNERRHSFPVLVRVGVMQRSSYDDYNILSAPNVCGVVSAWSAPLYLANGAKQAVKLVERRFSSSGERNIRIWEETGESIARHLWDAGITLSCCLNEIVDKENAGGRETLAKVLRTPKGKERLQVLELGTGCGMVGITIAQRVVNADIILTDLPEAEEIVQKNMTQATLAKDSTLSFQTLDWEIELPRELNSSSECPHCTQLDLIVAADCTYNPDSSPALVKTMSRLAQSSPNSVIVVAMKMRHSSEEIFFSLMSKAGFTTTDPIPFPLPGDEIQGEEVVYVHLYRYKPSDRYIEASPNESCLAR